MFGLELDNQSLAVTFGKYQPHVYLIQTTSNVDSLLIDVGHFQCRKKAKTPLQTHRSNYRLRVRTAPLRTLIPKRCNVRSWYYICSRAIFKCWNFKVSFRINFRPQHYSFEYQKKNL